MDRRVLSRSKEPPWEWLLVLVLVLEMATVINPFKYIHPSASSQIHIVYLITERVDRK